MIAGVVFKDLLCRGNYHFKVLRNTKDMKVLSVSREDLMAISNLNYSAFIFFNLPEGILEDIDYYFKKKKYLLLHHGSRLYNPDSMWFNQINEVFDGVFALSYYHERELKDYFNMSNVCYSGYPMNIDEYRSIFWSKWSDKRDTILFPGRLDIDKMNGYAVYAANKIAKETNLKVIFTSPFSEDEELNKINYNYFRSLSIKNIEFLDGISENSLLELYKISKYVFVRGMADSNNLVAQEAALAGCRVLAPAIEPYHEYLYSDSLYSPFYLKEMMDLLNNHTGTTITKIIDRLDYREVFKRMRNFVEKDKK